MGRASPQKPPAAEERCRGPPGAAGGSAQAHPLPPPPGKWAAGAGTPRIIFRHILPNAIGPILVQAAFAVAGAMLAEAALDFLGFGLPPGIPTWGNLMTQAQNYMTSNPVLVIAPGLVVTLTVVAVFFVGDAVRDALDVRSR